jgi:hypothetical protein
MRAFLPFLESDAHVEETRDHLRGGAAVERWLRPLLLIPMPSLRIEGLYPALLSAVIAIADAPISRHDDLHERRQPAERGRSMAGRTLFRASRTRRASANDADRLRKYLQRFGLDWARLTG